MFGAQGTRQCPPIPLPGEVSATGKWQYTEQLLHQYASDGCATLAWTSMLGGSGPSHTSPAKEPGGVASSITGRWDIPRASCLCPWDHLSCPRGGRKWKLPGLLQIAVCYRSSWSLAFSDESRTYYSLQAFLLLLLPLIPAPLSGSAGPISAQGLCGVCPSLFSGSPNKKTQPLNIQSNSINSPKELGNAVSCPGHVTELGWDLGSLN